MTREQAGSVVAVLVAGFPQLVLEAESIDLFVDAIAKLEDVELAREVAQRIVETRPRFPALSELLDECHAMRRRRAQAVEPAPAEPVEYVSAEEIAAFVAALHLRHSEPEPVLPLTTPGECADCGQIGDRVQSGHFERCPSCAHARIRVGDKLANAAGEGPDHQVPREHRRAA